MEPFTEEKKIMGAVRDLAKLPKWARSEIERLTRDCASLEARLSAGPENSNTFADPFSDAKRPLGTDTTIEFVLNPNAHAGRGSRIRVDIRNGVLDVNGDESLTIRPRASNSIEIGLVQR